MKKIYIAAAILLAVAITEGCMKQRVAATTAQKPAAQQQLQN